jgi:hypothetical protein
VRVRVQDLASADHVWSSTFLEMARLGVDAALHLKKYKRIVRSLPRPHTLQALQQAVDAHRQAAKDRKQKQPNAGLNESMEKACPNECRMDGRTCALPVYSATQHPNLVVGDCCAAVLIGLNYMLLRRKRNAGGEPRKTGLLTEIIGWLGLAILLFELLSRYLHR